MRTAVVVPGKFDVLALAPHSRLNNVVLPVFGLPTSATRTGDVAVISDVEGASTGAAMVSACVAFRE